MQKIGFSLQNTYSLPISDVIRLLKKTGFDAISPIWGPATNLKEITDTAAECKLAVQSLHATYQGIAHMWSTDETLSSPTLQALMTSVEDCQKYRIPILVIHPWSGFDYHFCPETLYFHNFDLVVQHAQSRNVRIAFENLEGPEFLGALLEHYKDSPTVGYCWDSGHELCYLPETDLLGIHGQQLIMTHLHDNFSITRKDRRLQGADDLHLIPGDGVADWDYNIDRLKKAPKQEILNFELKINENAAPGPTNPYANMSLEQYIQKAYQRARSIAERYSFYEKAFP